MAVHGRTSILEEHLAFQWRLKNFKKQKLKTGPLLSFEQNRPGGVLQP
jgi:hypothetical protein